jgi:osmoprotectant transport system substrate-binding protein
MKIKKRYLLGAFTVVAALALSACGSSSNPSGGDSTTASSAGSSAASTPAGGGSITIGSANFPENVLLMQIYAGALKAKGVTVTTKPNLGARPVYVPALEDGSIDLIPEYTGNLLLFFDKTATQISSEDIYAALKTKAPDKLTVLDQAAAQDKDAIVVTQATATKYNLKSIGDLAAVASNLTFGAAPEWQTQAYGAPALKTLYNVTFGTFKALDSGGPLTENALKNGQIDAGDIYTTDPFFTANNWVALDDPKNEFIAQNVVPLIAKSKVTPTISDALNAVSAKLDTATLASLVGKVVADKQDPATVASDWLKSVSLG